MTYPLRAAVAADALPPSINGLLDLVEISGHHADATCGELCFDLYSGPLPIELPIGGPDGFVLSVVSLGKFCLALLPELTFRLQLGALGIRLPEGMYPATLVEGRWVADTDERSELVVVATEGLAVRWGVEGGFRVSAIDDPLVIPLAFSLPPTMLGATGVVFSFDEAQLDLSESNSPDEILQLGLGPEFQGVYVQRGQLHLLSQSVFGGTPGLNLELEEFAVGNSGISGLLRTSYDLQHANGRIDPSSGLVGELFDGQWQVGLSLIEVDLFENSVRRFLMQGLIRVPLLNNVIRLGIGLQRLAVNQYRQTLSCEMLEPMMVSVGPAQLDLAHFAVAGYLDPDGFSLDGEFSGSLTLPGFSLNISSGTVGLSRSPASQSLSWQFEQVDFGPLGQVELAHLAIQQTHIVNSDDDEFDVSLQATIAWQEIRSRLPLASLPQSFPLPPNDAKVSASLRWRTAPATEVDLRLSVDVTDVDGLWQFMPAAARPEVDRCQLSFDLTYADQTAFAAAANSNEIDASLAAEFIFRLPPLDGPFADLLDVETGDPDGWVTARLEAGEESGEAFMRAGIENPVKVDLQIPGFPQAEAPIHISLSSVEFDLAASDAAAGRIRARGEFVLRPIQPPAYLPLSHTLSQLFANVGLSDLVGQANFVFEFDGGNFATSVDLEFDEAEIEIDVFEMIGQLSHGLAATEVPEGTEIPLDLDVRFRLKKFSLQLGTLQQTSESSAAALKVLFELSFGPLLVDVEFVISDQLLSIGIVEMRIPIRMPEFPLRGEDIRHWSDRLSSWSARIQELELLDPQEGRQEFHELGQLELQRVLLQAIIHIRNDLISRDDRRETYEDFAATTVDAIQLVSGVTHFETELEFVLEDIQFAIPFADPQAIGLSGSAHLEGFQPDDPLRPLGDLDFSLGLAPDVIFFSLEGGPDPIPLPEFGRYPGGSVNIDRVALGYAFTRNGFRLAVAGELILPPQLVEDIDTSESLGFGVRPPSRTAVGFKLDLIPVSLGPVEFVIPLIDFELDMRSPNMPALLDPARCDPAWDGLQTIVPGLYHDGIKHVAFSLLFSGLPIPNASFDGDLKIGSESNGLSVIADDVLVLAGLWLGGAGIVTIPFLADPTMPYFENLCVDLRLSGFGLHIHLQRPLPSLSPLALFEVLGLIADPQMSIEPDGVLAKTIHVTLQDAHLTLPPAVERLFPAASEMLQKRVQYSLNLGTVIQAIQAVAPIVSDIWQNLEDAGRTVEERIEHLMQNPPSLTIDQLYGLLPSEVRKFDLRGSLGGFEATVSVLLITPGSAAQEFDRRDHPPPTPVAELNPSLGQPVDPSALFGFQPNVIGAPSNSPTIDPTSEENNLLLSGEFSDFGQQDLMELVGVAGDDAGVVVGATVRVFQSQQFKFLGSLTQEGRFVLISSVKVNQLALQVAGLLVQISLDFDGRMVLRGAVTELDYAGELTATVATRWNVIPGIAEVSIRKGSLMLRSDGSFLLEAEKGRVSLFNGAAEIRGNAEVSHTHCFVDGTLRYRVDPIIDLSVRGRTRIGPGTQVTLSGDGDLKILGNEFAQVRATVTEREANIEGQIAAWRLGKQIIPARRIEMNLRGAVDLRCNERPSFHLEGTGRLNVFGATIRGRAGIQARPGDLIPRTYFEGRMAWQGRTWVDARIELGTDSISIFGKTEFALDVTPSSLANEKVSSLFTRISIALSARLDTNGALAKFGVEGDWMLAWKHGDQTVPIAMHGFEEHGSGELDVPLIDVSGFNLMPFGDFETELKNLELTFPRLQPQGDVVAKLGTTKNDEMAAYWAGNSVVLSGGVFPVIHFDKDHVKKAVVSLHSSYEVTTQTIKVNDVLNAFDLRLAWRDGRLGVVVNGKFASLDGHVRE